MKLHVTSPSKSKFTLLVLFAVVALFLQLGSLGGQMASPGDGANASSLLRPRSERRAKLGDGCYHVFLDVGSNIGIHARFLYEPDLYPESASSVPRFAAEFGYPRDNRDYCVFSFEPNPKFERRHREMEEAYRAMGWRYTPVIAGASDADGNFTFYHSAFEKEAWETGFSALAATTLYGSKATTKTVQIVRLASWIADEIQDRRLPATTYSKEYTDPKVVMKLDIEGLEFRVFPDLLTTGALCNNVHFLLGEFHHQPGNHNYYPMNLTSDGKHVLHHRKEGEQLARQLLHLVDISDTCMTRISLEDDESYLEDPHGLPIRMVAKTPN